MKLNACSIRTRLLGGILFALVLILASAAWWSYSVTKHESEELFSARLATSARVLDAFVARQVEHATIERPLVIALPDELEHATNDAGSPLGHPYETKIAFQIWHEDGRLLVRSKSAPDNPFGPNQQGFSTQTLEGVAYNVFVLRSGGSWIQVAEKDEVRDELLHDLGIAVMTPLVAGAALLLILVNLLVVYGLAPLRQLAASIGKRDPDSLGLLETETVPEEVAPVVQALNDLLVRVHDALEHERRFTDAAAHELRTPLAALRIHADNMARATTEEERIRSMNRLRQGLERASKLAEQMLAYSRTQDSTDRESPAVLDLAALIREVVAQLEPLRQTRSQNVELDMPTLDDDGTILGEPTLMRRLVINLLDNASRYAPNDATIRVGLHRRRDRLELIVANPGSAIPAELRSRVFEPYYRIPGSGSDGSGLGLAIVKEIADRHGATIELETLDDGSGTRLRILFPIAPGSSPGPIRVDRQGTSVRAATATASAASPAALTRSPP